VAGVRRLREKALPASRPGAARLADPAVWRSALPLCPLLLFLTVFFLYPVGQVLSLSIAPGSQGSPFHELFTTPVYRAALWRTLHVSLTVTLACLALGYPVAYTVATAPRPWSGLLLTLAITPFWISILGRSFTWLVLLQRNGVVNQLLQALGLTREPVSLVYNAFGVYIGMIHILLPFMILSLYSVLRGIDGSLLRAATSLGATEWQTFRHVYLPLSLPGIAAGAVLLFIMGLGFFITPALLGGGRVTLVTMLIETNIHATLNWPMASALSVVLLSATLLVLIPSYGLLHLDRAFGAGPR
jgi:ABC-type spermidine/putrescine transport system permease subunit I